MTFFPITTLSSQYFNLILETTEFSIVLLTGKIQKKQLNPLKCDLKTMVFGVFKNM